MIKKDRPKTKTASLKNEKLKALKEIFQPEKELLKTSEARTLDDSQSIARIIKGEHTKRRRHALFLTAIIFFLCAAAGVSGLLYFRSNNPLAQENIKLEIVAPEKAKIGSEITYKFVYENTGNVSLGNAKLIIKEPAGWHYQRSAPEIQGHSFDIGDLAIGQGGSVSLTGTLIDDLANTQKLIATMIFVPNNFNSEFSVVKEYSTSLEPLNLELTTKALASTTPGATFKAELTLTNKENYTISKLKIDLKTPNTFKLEQADPKTGLAEPSWTILNLAPAATQKISLAGTFPKELKFDNEDARTQTFILNFSVPSVQDIYFPAGATNFTTKIVDQALTTHLIVNGSTNNKNITLDDKLHFTIGYKNASAIDYKDIGLALIFNISPIDIIDWNKLPDIKDGHLDKTASGKIIAWTTVDLPDLGLARRDGTFDITLSLKSSQALAALNPADLANLKIETYSELRLKDATGIEQPAIDSGKIYLQLNSDTALDARARYFLDDGTPVGSGPLPPQVGQATTYQVSWTLNNSIHEIKNVVITTTLPANVTWSNKFDRSTGEINYDAATRKITWAINRLPRDAATPNFTFQISLEPKTTDAGKLLKLTESTTLNATDAVTLDTLNDNYGILSSNLDQDAFGTGRGIVIK